MVSSSLWKSERLKLIIDLVRLVDCEQMSSILCEKRARLARTFFRFKIVEKIKKLYLHFHSLLE